MSRSPILRGTFVFDPDNQRFVEGQGGRPAPERFTDVWVWTPVGLSLLVASVLGPLLLWRAGAPWFVLVLVLLGSLGAAPMGGFALAQAGAAWQRARLFRRAGVLLTGRLLQVSAADADLDGFEVLVSVDYTFTDPDGCEVHGRATRRRHELAAAPLPPRNTPLALLYISPHQYELL